MCDPGTIIAGASLAIQVGGTLVGAGAQNKAAKKNKAAALAAMNQDFRALGLQQQQIEDAATVSIMTAHRQALAADASARVSAGAAGVAGASIEAIASDIAAQESQFDVQTKRNLQASLAQIQQEKAGTAAGAQSRIAAVQPANPLATGLQIATAGLGFAANQIKINNQQDAKGAKNG